MPIPSSGQFSIGQIKTELGIACNATNYPLAGSAVPLQSSVFGRGGNFGIVNQTAPHALSEFRGYNAIVSSNLLLYINAAVINSYIGSGTLVNDLSGNANNGVLINGPTFTTDGGGGLIFDGSNDYAEFDNTIKGANTDNFTLCCFMRCSSYGPGVAALVRGRDQAGAYYEGWSMFVGADSSGKPQTAVVTTTPNIAAYTTVSDTAISTNTWFYVVGVWTAGTSLAVYVNGVLQKSTANTSTNLRNSSTGFVLATAGVSAYYGCTVANAQAYNRALTASEILQNFNSQKSRFGL